MNVADVELCVRYQAMELSPNLTQCGLGAEAYPRAKFHFDPPYHVATIHQRTGRQTGQDRTHNGQIAYGEPFYKRSPKNGCDYVLKSRTEFQ